jgi:hypothetical protein
VDEGRLDALADRVEHLSQEPRYAVGVAVLRCFRGFDTITATAIVVELHTFHRYRGRVELPAPTPRGNAGAAQEGTAAKGDRTRRSRHAAPLPPIRPIDTQGSPPQKAIVAVARELVGFVWAALTPLPMGTELPQAS